MAAARALLMCVGLVASGLGAPASPAASVFTVTDKVLTTGSDVAHLKVLTNTATGEQAEIVINVGGRVEGLYLRSNGRVRKVLDNHNGNATAIATNPHWKGEVLLPYANRIANGTYVFFGERYNLPLNEPARNNSIHGLMWNKTLSVAGQAGTDSEAWVHLQYEFEDDVPGYPFHLLVDLTYTLNASGFMVTVGATNLDPHSPLPFYNSWHPYFLANVSRMRVEFDSCAQWNHVDVYNNSNLFSNLIPTGQTTLSIRFNGTVPIGGTDELPTYFDDEFKARSDCGPIFRHRIMDGADTTVLWGDHNYKLVQIFTGARRLWGVNAVALEPMSGMCDAFNNHDNLHIISGGERFESRYGVYSET